MISFKDVLKRGASEPLFGNGRIPAIDYVERSNLLVSVCGCRTVNPNDLPNGAKIGFIKSTDDGKVFTKLTHIMDIGDDGGLDDPCIVVNQSTNRIFVFATSGLRKDGSVGSPWHGKNRIYFSYSDDLGDSWTKPQILNIAGLTYNHILVVSCGNGIYVDDLNRIIVPLYGIKTQGETYRATFTYSDDNGATWKQGGDIGDGVSYIGENRIIKTKDEMICIGRTLHGNSRSDWRSEDNGTTWVPYEPTNFKILNDIGTALGLGVVNVKGEEYLLYSSCDIPNHFPQNERRYGRLKISDSNGNTWRNVCNITGNFKAPSNFFAYSCLVVGNGKVFIMYETDNYETLKLMVIDLDVFI